MGEHSTGVHTERMEMLADAETITYSHADLTETIGLFEQHGTRFL